ncbi:MAG: hypothetical protein ACLQVX_08685 [Limisphaerales bacterium]
MDSVSLATKPSRYPLGNGLKLSTGHGNHWECLGGTAEERVSQFVPLVIAKGEVGAPAKRASDSATLAGMTGEEIVPIIHPTTPLHCMALLVSNPSRKKSVLYGGFPCAATGGKQRLRIEQVRDWGDQVEGVLFCETAAHGQPIGFFDTHFYANHGKYKVGREYDFVVAGLIYGAECTNEKTVTATDQSVLRQRYAAMKEHPEPLPDGTLPPLVYNLAGLTALVPGEKYIDDAEFYCVVDKVFEFDLEDIHIFQITPRFDDDCRHSPLPAVIYGAATKFKNGYLPKPGDSIAGMLWVQGFLHQEPALPTPSGFPHELRHQVPPRPRDRRR